MRNKDGLEFGTKILVNGVKAEIWDLCDKNALLVKVLMKAGHDKGLTFLVPIAQVEKA